MNDLNEQIDLAIEGAEDYDVTITPEDEPVGIDQTEVTTEQQQQTEEQVEDQVPEETDADVLAVLAGMDSNAEVEALKARIAQLEARQGQQPAEPPKPVEYVGEEEFEELFQDRAKLNDKFNAIAQKAQQQAFVQAAQYMHQQITVQRIVDQFYSNNPDLKPHMRIVGEVSDRLMKQNPSITHDQLMDKTARVVRNHMKLPIPISVKKNAPAQPKVKGFAGNTKPPPPKNTMATQIDEIDKFMAG